ncbi:MAG: amino acid racemase [Reichenbachiella sp.]|uniref:aspartate/glutamate racemase family protein n=1 Tax=Reichenbachiella sp. TaxID=2184521 RepID=UPI0032992770
MKSIGLIGGTSWHSTVAYYRLINQQVNDAVGARVNPPLILINLNQEQIHAWQRAGQWAQIAAYYEEAFSRAASAGAEQMVMCANTAHAIYDLLDERWQSKVIHMGTCIAHRIKALGGTCAGLIGTIFTMEQDYISRWIRDENVEVLVPEQEERNELHHLIQNELAAGQFTEQNKRKLIANMDILKRRGADCMILACTEFPLLIKPDEYSLPLLNTTEVHAQAAVQVILSKTESDL